MTDVPIFHARLVLDAYKDNEWVVRYPLRFTYRGVDVTVPTGFITDLASVPRAVQLLPGFGVNGRSRKPAVLHDYLYCENLFPRDKCDNLFRVALRAEGVNAALAQMYYLGVRTGGWLYYDKRKGGLDRAYDFVPDSYFEELPA